MPEEEKVKSSEKQVDLDTSGPEVDVVLEESKEEVVDTAPETKEQETIEEVKTDGGVILGTETIDRQQVASQCGNVLAMGPDCYNDPKRFSEGPWCKVGDWVVFARYAGSRIEIEGGEVRLLNDDEVLATVQDPTDILHKF